MNDRVLVVEDSPTQAEQLRSLLDDQFQVQLASTGEEALDLLSREVFDLVLSDVVMPGISGYELARRVKEDPALSTVPVILLTSLNDPMNIVRGLECGADNYVTKPYDADSLLVRVRRVLDTSRLRQRVRISSGVKVAFLGTTFTITSEKEQIIDLLLSSIEDVVRSNQALEKSQRQLAEAHAKLERFASEKVREARVSSERYRVLMEKASDAIIILNLQGVILEANHRAADLVGRSAAELRGHQVESFLVEEERAPFRGDLQGLRSVPMLERSERRLRNAEGDIIYCEISASLTSTEGEDLVMVIFHDVTARKSAEAALRQSEEQLKQVQKLEAIGRFAGGIAHDFNNLLGVIGGNAQLLRHDLEMGIVEPDGLDEILQATDRGAGLTRQLLAFSRRQLLETTIVDFNEAVRDVVKMLQRVIGQDINFETDLASNLGRVEADPSQVHQVLMNLVVNARDAMPSGGTVTVASDEIDLTAEEAANYPYPLEPGRYIRLRVSDTGSGMDEETMRQIFEPFFTTKGPARGTGLGLATVYGIVKQSGGFVSVESAVGMGSTFTVCLPRTEEKLAEAPASSRPSQPRDSSAVILLVEDEAALRRVLRRVLRESGYEVIEAENAENALLLLESHSGPIDLLLTDIVMPGMNGRELAIRLLESYPQLEVIYMSGHTDERIDREELLQESVHFIQKPFEPKRLVETITNALA